MGCVNYEKSMKGSKYPFNHPLAFKKRRTLNSEPSHLHTCTTKPYLFEF